MSAAYWLQWNGGKSVSDIALTFFFQGLCNWYPLGTLATTKIRSVETVCALARIEGWKKTRGKGEAGRRSTFNVGVKNRTVYFRSVPATQSYSQLESAPRRWTGPALDREIDPAAGNPRTESRTEQPDLLALLAQNEEDRADCDYVGTFGK